MRPWHPGLAAAARSSTSYPLWTAGSADRYALVPPVVRWACPHFAVPRPLPPPARTQGAHSPPGRLRGAPPSVGHPTPAGTGGGAPQGLHGRDALGA
eukprot:10742729-Alexandrium_andersonii.AAC.1